MRVKLLNLKRQVRLVGATFLPQTMEGGAWKWADDAEKWAFVGEWEIDLDVDQVLVVKSHDPKFPAYCRTFRLPFDGSNVESVELYEEQGLPAPDPGAMRPAKGKKIK